MEQETQIVYMTPGDPFLERLERVESQVRQMGRVATAASEAIAQLTTTIEMLAEAQQTAAKAVRDAK